MKSLIVLAFLALEVAARRGRWPVIRRQGGGGGRTPSRSCASLTAPDVPGASVVSIQSAERRNFSLPSFGGPGGPPGGGGGATAARLNFCDVNVTLTHGDTGDRVLIEVWLPLSGWNGRFLGTGGGGFVAGTFGQAMAPQVADGFAAASTDAGLDQSGSFDGRGVFGGDVDITALVENRTTLGKSEQLFLNFAHLSVHEMAVVGKAVTEAFYGQPPRASYWSGCSTGGRQGLKEAQMFPEDFDGILAIAPAINWGKFIAAGLWPIAVMNDEGEFPPACVFDAFVAATIEACDLLDGGADGLLADPASCTFDPQSIVGRTVSCNPNAGGPFGPGNGGNGNNADAGNITSVTLTARQATIYSRILDGASAPDGSFLWYSLLPGASLTALAGTSPFPLSATWISQFVLEQSSTDLSKLSVQQFSDMFTRAASQGLAPLINTDDPNLSAFRNAGGKILSWHGLADQLIMPDGTFDYLRRVEEAMGATVPAGAGAVDDFFRVFAAPGVGHCAGGAGPEPLRALDALVDWVEQGKAPETLFASKSLSGRGAGSPGVIRNGTTAAPPGTTVTRNLCRFPQKLAFSGGGDVNDAAAWSCTDVSAAGGDPSVAEIGQPGGFVGQSAPNGEGGFGGVAGGIEGVAGQGGIVSIIEFDGSAAIIAPFEAGAGRGIALPGWNVVAAIVAVALTTGLGFL